MEDTTTKRQLWVARDEDGSLYLYWFKPLRDKEGDEPGTFFPDPLKPCCTFDIIDYRMYPEVTWENSPQPLTTPITKES